jgi:hypothetical protein
MSPLKRQRFARRSEINVLTRKCPLLQRSFCEVDASMWCLPQGMKYLIKRGTGDLRLTHGNPLLLHKRLFTTTGSNGYFPSYITHIERNFFQSSMLWGYLQDAARREERKQVPVVPKKTCPCCDKPKDSTEFYRDASKAGGLYGYCKSCAAVRVAPEFQHNTVLIRSARALGNNERQPIIMMIGSHPTFFFLLQCSTRYYQDLQTPRQLLSIWIRP